MHHTLRLIQALLLPLATFTAFKSNAEENPLITVLQFEIAEKSVVHTYSQPGYPDVEFSGNLSSAIYGIGFSKGRFYTALSIEQPLRIDTSYKPSTQGFLNISRYDRNLTLGYSVTQRISVFCGFKHGVTEASGLSNENPADVSSTALEFVESGPYVGANMDFMIDNDNSIGINLAYADMDGDIRNTITALGGNGTGPASAYGTANGISLGIKWNHFLSDQTILNIGAKINQYETEATDLNGIPTSFESDYIYFNIGLSYVM